MPEPIFYIVELDFPEGKAEESFPGFYSWYASVHSPHLYEGGFTVCTSYKGTEGAMQMVDIYQADDWNIFTSKPFARYLEVAARDPWRPGYIGRTPNTRTPYHHVPWRGQSSEEMARPLESDWVAIWRFEADDAVMASVAEWMAEHGEDLFAGAGATDIRLLFKTKESPTGTSIRPGGAICIGCPREPAGGLGLGAEFPASLRAAIDDAPGFVGWRTFPWPDDAGLVSGLPGFGR
ncbi:MAG: hypothetical protein ACU0GE_15140 [Pseudooceanicola nanhaiensis]|uniref:hypothetical protein n=1 Tax=Rhodobacterales TaxID=204455 RepID=UPI0040595790